MSAELPQPPQSYRSSHKLLGPSMQRLHLSCEHFTDLDLQSRDRKLAFGEKLRYCIHYLICSVCRGFRKQMRAFSALVKSSFAEQPSTPPDPVFLTEARNALENLAKESAPPKS